MATDSGYNVRTIARLFHLTERRVQQLAREGIVPKASRGRYDLIGAVQGYVKYLQDRLNEVGPDHTAERARLDRMRADEVALRLERERGETISLDEATVVFTSIAAQAKTRLLGVPSIVAPLVVECTRVNEVKALLDEHIREALSGVDAGAAHRGGVSTAAPANGKRVGRRQSKAKPGSKR